MSHDPGLQSVLDRLLDETPNAFGVLDASNRLIFCNQHMASVFGLTPSEAIGRTHRDLMQHAFEQDLGVRINAADFNTWIADIESRQRLQKVRVFESDMNNGQWLQITQLIIDDYLVLIGTDITALKQTEQELQRALHEVQHLAHTDALTQVANRRHFFERAGHELARAQRYQRPLSLVMLDIDHFKQINDTHGHHAGDQVLQFVAAFYQQHLRRTDFFARLGGEEFVLLLPETSLDTALALADRLRERLAAEPVYLLPEPQVLHITLSAGVSLFEGQGDTIQTLLSRADAALYRAKAQGRNRCEPAPPWPAAS